MNTPLARAQQDLLAAIWLGASPDGPAFHARGLAAYRSHAQEMALRALSAAYPVVLQWLGEDNFGGLARLLWQRHPPSRGDIAQWGGELAGLIGQLPQLSEQEPYLADVARCEWALHRCASAADAQVDAASIELLTRRDPAGLTLVLAPGTALVASAWPVASICLARGQDQQHLQDVAQKVGQGIAQTALIWRDGHTPRLRLASPGEERFVCALLRGHSLAGALQPARGLDLSDWLAQAFQTRLLMGVRAL